MNLSCLCDLWTVVRKEWLEWFATFGACANVVIVVAVFGVLAPLTAGILWAESLLVQWLWIWMPLFVIIGPIADTFAGERERDTLEPLLASRLSERVIVLGKVVAAAAYGWGVLLLCVLASRVTVGILSGTLLSWAWLAELAFLAVLSLLAAGFSAIAGVLISMAAPTVRQAQQVLSVAMVVMALLTILLSVRLATTLPVVFGAGAMLAVVNLGLLGILLMASRRSQWLAHR